ncbi:alpha/beta hydrolase [Pseudoalteromonas piscicida]|uniref:alpha/beta hydrolase n=1 Tax=Pseudoalteromonas piscicida TaxID=43662 RepID=UPI0030ADAD15
MYRSLFAVLLMLSFHTVATTIEDTERDRDIPIKLYQPKNTSHCTTSTPCAVAMLSAGYGVPHTDYQFLAATLTQAGYLVIAVGHELPSDPPLSVKGNLYETRAENWQRGADTLIFVRDHYKSKLAGFDFDKVLLIGHSNGGDISAWLINHGAQFANHIITLDHRRVPLPLSTKVNVLSIRASDFAADPGVLPTEAQQQFNACVVTIPRAKHNDMSDIGPDWLKQKITGILESHLAGTACHQIRASI